MTTRAILSPILALTILIGAAPYPSQRMPIGAAERTATVETIAYGSNPLQQLDFYPVTGTRQAPLIIFVHGGGWNRGDKSMMRGSAKLAHWQARGYAVASLNYRLVPQARVEDQAADVASAIAVLKRQARRLGFDSGRVVLAGHSAGAHLAALVGTHPRWLRGAGLEMAAIGGVIALDGAGYDVPSQMGENVGLLGDTYEAAFGTDPVRQNALSPARHAAAPNAPAFLILHVERPDSRRQSEGLAQVLRRSGTPVELRAFAGKGLKGHIEINRRLGDADYPATPVVDRWLDERFR